MENIEGVIQIKYNKPKFKHLKYSNYYVNLKDDGQIIFDNNSWRYSLSLTIKKNDNTIENIYLYKNSIMGNGKNFIFLNNQNVNIKTIY